MKTLNIPSLKNSLALIEGITSERLEGSKNTKYSVPCGLIINVFDTGTVTFQGTTTGEKATAMMAKITALI
ncbi:hypothetical protein AB0W38_04250 [Aliarcobacter butzleri]|uniref:hypothetical protein n=1 Tax=Aliarcobacter butzleri TaxID=28197 RepID=UPI00344B25B3